MARRWERALSRERRRRVRGGRLAKAGEGVKRRTGDGGEVAKEKARAGGAFKINRLIKEDFVPQGSAQNTRPAAGTSWPAVAAARRASA